MPPLKLVSSLLKAFNRDNIRYCHWKSNEHLEAALSGDTDLDILMSQDDYEKGADILSSLDFREFRAMDYLSYDGIQDFIGCDPETGKIIHVHLHTKLRIGRRFIKDYHLPVENSIFNNLVLDRNNNIYTIDPNIELVLLLVRFVLKKKGNRLIRDFETEFNWLMKRIDKDKVRAFTAELFDDECADALAAYVNRHKDTGLFRILKNQVDTHMERYAAHSPVMRKIVLFMRKARGLWNYKWQKWGKPIPYKRVFQGSGKAVAIIGVDGAGKSTAMQEIKGWSGKKIDTYIIYFGSGSGRSSLLRYPLQKLMKIYKKFKRKRASHGAHGEHKEGLELKKGQDKISSRHLPGRDLRHEEHRGSNQLSVVSNQLKDQTAKEEKSSRKNRKDAKTARNKRSFLFRTVKAVWAILLAFEKKSKLKKMNKAKKRGMLVICDRYPQAQIMGYNDGPLLTDWLSGKSRTKMRIAKWEHRIYAMFDAYPLDAVIKLLVSEEIAHTRKPDTDVEMVKKKIEAVKSLAFSESTNVIEIDASDTLKNVLLEVKRNIWAA